MTMQRPNTKPVNRCFSSGPCAKRPGWSLSALAGVLSGRSHRSAPGKARLREVIKYVPAERVAVTTDCGMKQLPRVCAVQKLHSLTAGAEIVRAELEGRTAQL